MHLEQTMTDSGRRARGEDGAAIVEFTLVAVLLLTLVFGIIQFGLILSFKQDMTRAAAEGARAGAVAVGVGGQTVAEAAVQRADAATREAVEAFGGSFSGVGCAREGMDCGTPVVAPCTAEAGYDCVTVTLTYDYDNHPLFGRVPIIEAFLPDQVKAESVARINLESNP